MRYRCPNRPRTYAKVRGLSPDGSSHTVIGCGSTNTSEPDYEGLVDCYECGIWFDPAQEDPADVYPELGESHEG